jgi:galactokinase
MKDFLLSKLEQHPCFNRPKYIPNPLLDSDLNEISLRNSKIHISRCPGRLSFSKHCDYVNNDLLYLAANYETLVAVQVSVLALGEISILNETAQAFIEIYNLNPDFQELILSQDQVIENISAIKSTISDQCLNDNKSNWTFYILKILDLLSKEDLNFDLAKILSLKIVVNSDLPAAAGMSSSHALILASFMSLTRALHSQGLLKNIDKTYFRYLLNSGADSIEAIINTNDLLDLLKFCQKIEIAKGFNSGLGDQAAQILSRKNHLCFIKLFPELSFKYQKIPEDISFMILPSFIKAEKTSDEYKLKEKYFDQYQKLNQLTPFFLNNSLDAKHHNGRAAKQTSSKLRRTNDRSVISSDAINTEIRVLQEYQSQNHLGDLLYKLADKEILEKLKKLKETQDDKKLPNLALYALAEGARLKDLKQNFCIEKMFEYVNLSHLAEWVSDSSPHPMIFSADLKLGNTIFTAQESININLKLANHIGAYRSSTLFNDSLQSFALSLEGVYACSIMGAGLGGNNIAVVSSEKIDSIKKTLIEDFYSHYDLAEKAKTAILVNSSADGLEYLGEF